MTDTNKTIGIVLMILGLAVILLLVLPLDNSSDKAATADRDEVEDYFIDTIKEQTLERINGQPIEGLEQSMYMSAYPGLQESDFENVETLGDTNEADVRTSADAMITDAGLVTLLENVSDRLDLEVDSIARVDALLVTLSSSTEGPPAAGDPAADAGDSDTSDNDGDDGSSGVAQACSDAGGTWLAEHNECEYVSAEWCSQYNGTFQECASACRHDPEADVCTMQCVPVCQLE